MGDPIPVLNKGFVALIDSMGNDLRIVNAARISFRKKKEIFDLHDEKLLMYLITNKHFSPFRHAMFTFHVKAPEVVTRQWYKHVVGVETTSSYPTKDHGWNEMSGRYIPVEDHYVPDHFRMAPENRKQGSGANAPSDIEGKAQVLANAALEVCGETYYSLMELGIAPEMARMYLPITFYTEFYWTASFQAVMHFINLRAEEHAQWEIQQYAKVMESMVEPVCPTAFRIWKALAT